MATDIKCPSCGHQFEPNEAIRKEVERELRSKVADWQKKKDDEFQLKMEEERKKIQKSTAGDYENQLRLLEQNNKENEEKLKEARRKEADFMRKEQELKTKEEEMDLIIQKQLQQERDKLADDIRKIEEQKIAARETEYQLRMKELEKQLEDQKKLAEEMRRKAEQGSTQLQGESQELLLEDMLRAAFPFDTVSEVAKGVEGADCILIVRNKLGIECGKIIFESKRTKAWSNSWLEKLKADMRSQQADVAILVSQVFPKGMDSFGQKEGIWIASFKECIGLTIALRNAIIQLSDARRSEENKGDKMQMLYEYLTGVEFRQSIEAIVEGFMAMKLSISKERIQMEKLWKEREKQLEKVLLSTSGLYGSIKGIAGSSVQEIPLLELSQDKPEEDTSTMEEVVAKIGQ